MGTHRCSVWKHVASALIKSAAVVPSPIAAARYAIPCPSVRAAAVLAHVQVMPFWSDSYVHNVYIAVRRARGGDAQLAAQYDGKVSRSSSPPHHAWTCMQLAHMLHRIHPHLQVPGRPLLPAR